MKKYILLFICTISIDLFAQNVRILDKPLRGAKTDHIPVKSLDHIEQNGKPSLAEYAIRVGKAAKESFSVIYSEDRVLEKKTLNNAGDFWKVEYAPNGTVNWMWRLQNTASHSQQTQSPIQSSPMKTLVSLKKTLKLNNPETELSVISDEKDDLGYRHTRYAQYYKNIPVWNRDLYVHSDNFGEPYIINGTYIPTPTLSNTIASIQYDSVISIITKDLIIKNSYEPISKDVLNAFGIKPVTRSLVIYPSDSINYLAYEIDIHPNIAERYLYLVDAHSGKILRCIEKHCSVIPRIRSITLPKVNGLYESLSKNKFTIMAGFVNATGIDLNSESKSIRMYQHTDGTFYSIWDLPNFDLGKSQMPNSLSGGAVTLSANNKDLTNNTQLSHVTSSTTTLTDRAGVSALSNMKICYDYYKNTFDRKAIDDKNGTLISIIHVTEGGQGMDNAYWNGKVMLYGDGNQLFLPLAGALDVAGHEMTHGVIENTANLVYEFQPGALNESFADIFGYFIEPSSFLLGEKVMKLGHSCLRDLENPANPTGLSHQPAHMNEFRQLTADEDNGGVHQNSGITNRAAAIIIKAIGREKAQQIYYRALSKYMTRNSQFIDCRLACESAAKDLFPGGNELSVVQNAFAAVGIGGASGGGNNNNVPSRIGGKEYIAYILENGRVGYIDPITTNAFLFSELAMARVSNNNFKAQLTAPRDGRSLWFISKTGLLTFIDLESGDVMEFPNLMIEQKGDLWNAAISPDGKYAALTSAYADDPNIYLFDGTQIVKLPILTEGGDGSQMQTVDYPDVINWSPNKNQRRLAFDAFTSLDINGFTSGYWSIYELNFDTKRMYNLIPAQPSGVDVGNIIYGNTDPDNMAFNIVANGIWDIGYANFQTNTIAALGIPNGSIGGRSIIDAEKPSFNVSDNFLCFSSVSNNAVVFLNGQTLQLTYLQYAFTPFNPYMFLFNGVESAVKNEPSSTIEYSSLSPNINQGQFTIRFDLTERSRLHADVVNIFGQTVETIADEVFEAGSHSMDVNTSITADGVYFVRLLTKSGSQVLRFVVHR